jgi:hypothetical protein
LQNAPPTRAGPAWWQLLPVVWGDLSREAKLMTDKASYYKIVGKEFASHDSVDH